MDDKASKLPYNTMKGIINNLYGASSTLPNGELKDTVEKMLRDAGTLNYNSNRFDKKIRRDQFDKLANEVDELLTRMIR